MCRHFHHSTIVLPDLIVRKQNSTNWIPLLLHSPPSLIRSVTSSSRGGRTSEFPARCRRQWAVYGSGIDHTSPDLYQNIWPTQGEIPASLPRIDFDDGGLVTFRDLNQPAYASLISDHNQNGYIDAGDLLQDPLWMDQVDGDGNGLTDDLIGWDFTDHDALPLDENGDGTNVSCILAATGNNSIVITGVNWNAQIMVVKFLDQNLHGDTADAVSSLNYVTQFRQSYLAGRPDAPDVRIANNSWEIRPSNSVTVQGLNGAITAATG